MINLSHLVYMQDSQHIRLIQQDQQYDIKPYILTLHTDPHFSLDFKTL